MPRSRYEFGRDWSPTADEYQEYGCQLKADFSLNQRIPAMRKWTQWNHDADEVVHPIALRTWTIDDLAHSWSAQDREGCGLEKKERSRRSPLSFPVRVIQSIYIAGSEGSSKIWWFEIPFAEKRQELQQDKNYPVLCRLYGESSIRLQQILSIMAQYVTTYYSQEGLYSDSLSQN